MLRLDSSVSVSQCHSSASITWTDCNLRSLITDIHSNRRQYSYIVRTDWTLRQESLIPLVLPVPSPILLPGHYGTLAFCLHEQWLSQVFFFWEFIHTCLWLFGCRPCQPGCLQHRRWPKQCYQSTQSRCQFFDHTASLQQHLRFPAHRPSRQSTTRRGQLCNDSP